MMKGQAILRDQGEAGRWRTSLLGLAVLVVTLMAALLVSTSTAGSQDDPPDPEPVYGPSGTLDLFADTGGDGVDFTPTGASEATLEESFTSNNKAQLFESGANLVVLTETAGRGGGQLPYVGLKDGEIGVRSKGEGSGTPASRIDGPTGNETLTIELGPDTPGTAMRYAEVALSLKFNVVGTIAAIRIDDSGAEFPVHSVPIDCIASDCGPDSGGDRDVFAIGDDTTPDSDLTATDVFTKIRITITNGGAASLIDDPGFDTYIEVVEEFDGVLACDQPTGDPDDEGGVGTITGVFTRLFTPSVVAGCPTLKFFNFDVNIGTGGEPQLEFEPNDPVTPAAYRGDIVFTAERSGSDDLSRLEYDADGPGDRGFVPMQWCERDPVTSGEWEYQNDPDGDDGEIEIGDLYFPEYEGTGTSGGDLHPVMPTTPDLDPTGDEYAPTSCIVSFFTNGLTDTWVTYVEADPWFRR